MKKINSLILLVNTLSKSEKKAIYLHSNLTRGKKVYMELFELIDKRKIVDSEQLYKEFKKKFSKASFHPVAKYLYEFVLNVLAKLKTGQDREFGLYQKILNAKILSERNLDAEYYNLLQQLKDEAKEIGNYNILLTVKRMELDFLRTNGFNDISEKELAHKQYKTSDTLKILRQINEQSVLYELLLYRVEKTPVGKSNVQKQHLNDLVISEISLVSNLSSDVFEIQKLHQLFQAQYLLHIGDYKSAFNSFVELDNLFSANPNLWNNPPLYYASVLEGIFESLVRVKKYDEISYFLGKLEEVEHASLSFQTEIACVRFTYTIIPQIETQQYKNCSSIIEQYQNSLISKTDLLTPYRYLQLSLYLSIVYLLNKEFVKARKQMTQIINSDSYVNISLYRPLQLINLLIHYELNDFDLVTSRIRSLKRHNKIAKKNSRLENLLFKFLLLDLVKLNEGKRNELKFKIRSDFGHMCELHEDRRLMSYFNFEDWVLSHI